MSLPTSAPSLNAGSRSFIVRYESRSSNNKCVSNCLLQPHPIMGVILGHVREDNPVTHLQSFHDFDVVH